MALIIKEETPDGKLQDVDFDYQINNAREAKEVLKEQGKDGHIYQIIKVHDRIQVTVKTTMDIEHIDMGMA